MQRKSRQRDAISSAGKLVLGVDYAKKLESVVDAYRKQREIGFVLYVSTVNLDTVSVEPQS